MCVIVRRSVTKQKGLLNTGTQPAVRGHAVQGPVTSQGISRDAKLWVLSSLMLALRQPESNRKRKLSPSRSSLATAQLCLWKDGVRPSAQPRGGQWIPFTGHLGNKAQVFPLPPPLLSTQNQVGGKSSCITRFSQQKRMFNLLRLTNYAVILL